MEQPNAQETKAQTPVAEQQPEQPGVENQGTPLDDANVRSESPEPMETEPTSGYLPRNMKRILNQGKWVLETDNMENDADAALDIYQDRDTFKEDECTVQIVTFHTAGDRYSEWADPATDHGDIRRRLAATAEAKDTWRLIHCEGLHGPTLKLVAECTGWNPREFSRVFTWSRASVEKVEGRLLVHFINQSTQIYVLYSESTTPLTFILCTGRNPRHNFMNRLWDFVDRGDSRQKNKVWEDPSLMLYGILRSIILDLRQTAFRVQRSMDSAYKKAMQRPSRDNLAFFYQLKAKLLGIKLDTTGLKNAVTNLNIIAKEMHRRTRGSTDSGERPLISQNTRYLLNDQAGLITLLVEELPDLSSQADAVGSLAFNTITFNTSNLLLLLTIITLASIPLTILSGLLGINWFNESRLDGHKIVLAFSITGAIILLLVVSWLLIYFPVSTKRKRKDYTWDEEQTVDFAKEYQFEVLEAENKKARDQLSKKDTLRPDVFVMAPQDGQTRPTSPRSLSHMLLSMGRQPPLRAFTSPVIQE
ncbi:hypothetical protein PIIN_03149 [Serendipita indica DSM 11827]|uniref:Uncharacterized protein n=1 Tax=Serendipita indica (strain DSM 11827) TaxID=1109443 RepID=G4TD64_SERID|nr:hypothetical protein PIIN_03149 [Serendipita indica DSM 11827]